MGNALKCLMFNIKDKDERDRIRESTATIMQGEPGMTENEAMIVAAEYILAEYEDTKRDVVDQIVTKYKAVVDKRKPKEPVKVEEPLKVEEPATIEYQDKIVERIDSADITADEMRAEFEKLVSNKESIHAELSKMTKAQLADRIRSYVRPDATKADMVDDAYESMLMDYWIGEGMFSYSMGIMSKEPTHVVIAKKVRSELVNVTDEGIKKYADKITKNKQEREEYKKEVEAGLDDPKTIDDYARVMRKKIDAGMTYTNARMSLTPEQRIEFDTMTATKTRADRESIKPSEIRTTVQTTTGDIIETKHTKTGEDLFVVKAADRVDREIYNQWNTTAKRLGGWYSSFKGAGAVPGFQFKTKENAEAFLKYLGGDVEQAKDVEQARRDSFADDKTQSAVERLNEMADRLESKADDSLNQDRKANTARRAGMAARAEANANADKALAVTMRNIANSIENGTNTFLDKVRQKVQVELLQSITNSAHYTEISKKYSNQYEKHRGETPTVETADYIDHPLYSAHRSVLAKLGRALIEVDGTKQLGKKLLSVADDVTKTYLDFAKKNLDKVHVFSTKDGKAAFKSKAIAEEAISRSGFKGTAVVLPFKRGENLIIMSPSEAMDRGVWKGDDDKMMTLSPAFGAELVEAVGKAARRGKSVSVPWQFEYVYDKRKRLSGMGIETPAELRAAVREYIGLMKPAEKPDKIKQMEREMIGRRNDGLDFFPTPAATADEMVDIADIKEGMKVLEPSAGMGHIAERIRESGVDPDVVEMSNDRKELLEAKGFNVVGRDFMDITDNYDRIIMNPPFSDRRDMEHVQHAYDLLNNDGRLVAIMGEGVFFGSDKKAQGFRDWLDKVGGTVEKLAEGTFNDPSLPVTTGVNARMVVIDKTADVKFSKTTGTSGSSVSHIESLLPNRVNDLVSAGKLNVVQSVDELPGALQEAGNALYHTVWHGSPHDHNKFDSSKIGTGEGAQAFGYGLFFTDTKKEIAEWYKEKLSKKVVTVDGKKVGTIDVNKNSDRIKIAKLLGYSEKTDIDNVQTIVRIYFSTGQDWNKVSAEIATYADYFRPRYETLVAEVKGRISSLNKGKLYQVELAPEQDEYLDWDKPLSEQSEKVKEALKDPKSNNEIYLPKYHSLQNTTGGSYYEWLSAHDQPSTSKFLHSIGIRGIRYKAEAGKSDAYNYVIFSDEDVSITEKFSKNLAAVEALYDKTNDKLYLVADMLNKNNIDPVLTHELLHRALATDKKVMQTFDQFKSALEGRFNEALNGKGSKMEVEAARRVVSADTPYQDQVEEFGAYLVTQYQIKPASLSGKVIKAIKDFLGAVRVYLLRNGLSLGFIKTLTPSDLVAIAGYGANVGDTAGEVEARNVQARAKMDDNFLRMTPPSETADVPDADVIVQWNGVRMDSETDIRYSRASVAISNAVSEDKLDKLIYKYQDRFIGLKRQQQKVGSITEDTDTYLAEELYSQRRAQLIKEFNDTEIDPLLKELHDNKIDLDTFQRFLQARHAKSRNAVMAERNPNQYMIDENLERAQESEDDKEIRLWSNAKPFRGTEEERLSLSGMSNDTAKAILDNADPIMFKLGDKIDDMTQGTLDLLVEYGMETQETVDALKAQWDHYVPLHRDEAHPEQGGFGQPIGQGFSVSGSGMKQATGSNADVTNIMAHLAAAREQMITRGEKNLVTQTLARFIEENPDPDFAEVNTPDVQNKLVNGLVEPVAANYFIMKQKPNVVSFRVDGKDSYIVFNEKSESNMDLAMSLQNLDGVDLDRIEKIMAKGTRWLASVNTQYNLVFGLFNFIRDVGGSALNLTTTPLHGKQLAVMSRIPKSLGTIAKSLRGDTVDQEYQEFLREGGAIGFTNMFENIDARNKSITDKLKRWDQNAPTKFLTQALPKFLNDFNTIIEHSTRFSAYQEAKAQGMSNAKAASLAKNLTVNFNRKGANTTKLAAYYAFLNASIQGTARTVETLRGPAGKQILLGGAGMGMVMTLLGIMNMGADDWDKIPEFVKERSLILTLPGMKGYVAIPLPMGFNIIPNVGRKFVESFIGSNKVSNTKRFGQLAGSLIGSFSPLGGGDLVSSVTPTTLDPAIDLLRNQDWTGKPIYRADFNSLKPTPGFTRTKENTSSMFKGAAEVINKATGGTNAKQGFWSPTGDQIAYVVGQLTGGTGRELNKVLEAGQSLYTGEELPIYRVPVIGKFVGKTSGNEAERAGYYDNIKTMFEHKEELETLSAKDRTEYLRDNPEARYVTALHKIELSVDKLKRQRKVLLTKSASTKALDDAIVKQMAKYNMLVDKVMQ